MGLGNDRKKYAYVTLRVQVGEGNSKVVDPAFVLSVKDEQGNYIKGEPFQYITGELVGIKKDGYTYQGREIPKVILFIYDKDDDTVYKVECGYNGLTRGVLNSLMTIPDYRDIQILVYKKTLKEKDNQVVPGAVVRWNFHDVPVKADWMVPPEDLKAKFVKTMIRGQEEVDSFPADQMIVDMAMDVIPPKLRSLDSMAPKPVRTTVAPGELPPSESMAGEDSILDQTRRERAERESAQLDSEMDNAIAEEGDDLPF